MKEIVIRMSDSMFERIMKAQSIPDMYGADIVNAMNCIKSGSVLPEGHGALINRNVVRKKCIQAQDWGDTNTYINRGLAIAVDFIDCAPTVIPADKENK